MRILNLKVEGFRSLKKVSWNPGPLNVIIGPNGTGKSNLLRAIEMISVSAQGGLAKQVQRAGGMEPLVWDGEADGITLGLRSGPLAPAFAPERSNLTYSFRLQRQGRAAGYRIEFEDLDYNFSTKENGDLSERILQRGPDLARASDERKELFEIPPKWIKEEETLLSIVKGPFVDNPPRELFWANVFTWGVYHDLRVDRDSAVRRDAVARSEKRVEPDGDNLINVLHTLYTTDRNFRDDIDGAMNAAFGDQFEELNFPPTADGRIQLRLRWKSLKREQSAADLSDGTLRFLYLLAILASPEPSPLIAIDEPETGLHPSMLGIIADFAIQAAERSQVILTTHSPAMLDAFNDKANPPTTTIATCENGETKLRIPPPDELKYWLKNYSLGQLFTSGELEQLGGVPA